MHFLVTAGGTREYIDPVRFISNASSGRMGFALGRAAVRSGHKVTLVTTPTRLRKPAGARVIRVETAAQMSAAVKRYFGGCDCLIMAAAVADYTPVRRAGWKIKKSEQQLTLKLKPVPDILKWAATHKKIKNQKSKPKTKNSKSRERFVVGFALEDRNIRPNAEKKLREKKLDMIIANSPAAIAAERAAVEIKPAGGEWLKLKKANKDVIARKVISLIEALTRQAAGDRTHRPKSKQAPG